MGKNSNSLPKNSQIMTGLNDSQDEQIQVISNDPEIPAEELQIELDYDELLKNRYLVDKKSNLLIRLSQEDLPVKKGGKKGKEKKRKKKVQQIDTKDITDIVIIVLLVLILGVSLFRVVMEVQIQYKKAQEQFSHNKNNANLISDQTAHTRQFENHQNLNNNQTEKQPEIQITLTPQCQIHIDNLLKQHGNLYDFKYPDKDLKRKSKVDVYVEAKNTLINREQFSQAVTLIRLVHHVNPNGTLILQNNPCEAEEQKRQRLQTAMKQQFVRLNAKYHLSDYHQRQLPFCLVVNSYNNAKSGLIYRNLDSILQQNYTNYHVVYTDDNSNDETGAKVLEYLKLKDVPQSKFNVTINRQKIGMMENIFVAVHKGCKDGEIVVMVDGDDSLIGINVLSLLNAVYQKEKLALLWSNFLCSFNNNQISMGFSRDYTQKQKTQVSFRKMKGFISSHLKTFYVDVFKKIKPEDLQYNNGKFYGGASDTAMMIPMIEMANPKIKYLPEVLYEYRYDTGQTGNVVNKVPQKDALAKIFSSKPYQKLSDFSFIERAIQNAMVIQKIQETKHEALEVYPNQVNSNPNK